jgi:hypothetical protein
VKGGGSINLLVPMSSPGVEVGNLSLALPLWGHDRARARPVLIVPDVRFESFQNRKNILN